MVADDHPVYRDGLRAIVEPHTDIELVGEAARGDHAETLVLKSRPDVVLMDLRMPTDDLGEPVAGAVWLEPLPADPGDQRLPRPDLLRHLGLPSELPEKPRAS